MTIPRGTDSTIDITFTENGLPFNITGYTILFTVKKQCDLAKDDTFALISKDVTTHTDPTQGKSQLILTNEDTDIDQGNYYWDIRLIKDGTISQTSRGEIEITQTVTKRNIGTPASKKEII